MGTGVRAGQRSPPGGDPRRLSLALPVHLTCLASNRLNVRCRSSVGAVGWAGKPAHDHMNLLGTGKVRRPRSFDLIKLPLPGAQPEEPKEFPRLPKKYSIFQSDGYPTQEQMEPWIL